MIADVLITEYSSVFFDFANLRRPMLFTTEEIIAALRDLPGMEERYRERYRLFYDKYCGGEKGDASRKVAERVFRL